MNTHHAIAVFQGKRIRRKWHDNQWYFVVHDIVSVLTDSVNPSDYLKKLRKRDEGFNEGWGQIVTPLRFDTPGGPQNLNCVNTESAFRLIQSIPSKKAEPFKRWLARVGYERVLEIENPELAQERMKELYEQKGYSKSWIDKRLRGIAVRQDLTDEWKKRSVVGQGDFAILTAEISKATFGMTPAEYKNFKGLTTENLRDHMRDLELIFTMLGEASTTEIERVKNPHTFSEHKKVSREGGNVAKKAKLELESKTKKPVMSKENYLDAPEKEKRKRIL
ncbi:MAG: Bro-N domain-containing protein [Nanoarchaeota archaeon]